jgi:hypothetical protein
MQRHRRCRFATVPAGSPAGLFLQKSIYNIPSILPKIGENKTHMHPTAASLRVLFPYKLVKWQVVLNILEPLSAFLDVAIYTEISGLPFHVLGVIHAPDSLV